MPGPRSTTAIHAWRTPSFMLAPASIRMGSLAGEYLTALWIRLRKTTLVSERSQ